MGGLREGGAGYSGVVTAVRTCDNLSFDCPLFLRGWRWGPHSSVDINLRSYMERVITHSSL